MNHRLKILVIDSHPIIIAAYKRVFSAIEKYEVSAEIADFYGKALVSLDTNSFHIAFIDLEMSLSNEEVHISVDRMPYLIKKKFPKTKVILVISENKAKTFSIIKSLPHDGLIVKRDFTEEIVLDALNGVLKECAFYSPTALKAIAETGKSNISLDAIDIKILQNLALGIRTKNLAQFIPLSLSAIEKRKGKIKIMFDVKSDESLLEKAREKGYV